jgi:succinate dehydrogenase/fumarate reductase flavoprotein subunit
MMRGIFNRRQLLGLGATLGGLGSLGALNAVHAQERGGNIKWDATTDVLVLGSGTGLLGALAAHDRGRKVLILEKRPVPGGNTGISGGVAWLPNNHLMKAGGIKDSVRGATQYVTQNSGGQASKDLINAFVAQAPKTARFLEQSTSYGWRMSKILPKVSDYHPEWNGSVLWGRSIEPDVKTNSWLLGGHMIAGLMEAVASKNIPLWTNARALRLIVQRDGPLATPEVLGVHAQRDGKPINIRARYGVHMATGGFEQNQELKRHFLRGPSPYTFGVESNTGDGLRMAMSVGADLRNMNELWSITVYKEESDLANQSGGSLSLMAQIEKRGAGAIAVNRYGERFCNEAGSYDAGWRSYLYGENWGDLPYRNLPAFHIYDNKMRQNKSIAGRTAQQDLPGWVRVADTLPKLARQLGIDEAGLMQTVKEFNEFAANGKDLRFDRGSSVYDRTDSPDPAKAGPDVTLAPISEPPFFGAEVAPADTGTCGGARVNGNAQVLDPFGNIIPRLYASGNCSGIGAPGTGYAGGGGTLGPALTFSYVAGTHVAGLRPKSK